jgi:hypothetical protein
MPVTPKVPHDDLLIQHHVQEADEAVGLLAEYTVSLHNPDGLQVVPPIIFHKGSPVEGWHGWTTAHVITGLIKHMEYHQSTPLYCEENEEILFHLRAAYEATQKRATERKGRGVLYDHTKP